MTIAYDALSATNNVYFIVDKEATDQMSAR